jgi:hypothetical protein
MREPVARTFNVTKVIATWRPVYVGAGEVSRFDVGELTDHEIIRTVLDQTRTLGNRSIDGEKTDSLIICSTIVTLYLVGLDLSKFYRSWRKGSGPSGITLALRPSRPCVFRSKCWQTCQS